MAAPRPVQARRSSISFWSSLVGSNAITSRDKSCCSQRWLLKCVLRASVEMRIRGPFPQVKLRPVYGRRSTGSPVVILCCAVGSRDDLCASKRSGRFDHANSLECSRASDLNTDGIFPLHETSPAYKKSTISSRVDFEIATIPQYAHFLPKYLPRYGTKTIVRSSSNCCKLSLHSRSASDSSSSSLGDMEVVEPADEDGRESTSSNVLAGGMLAYDEDGSDMMAVVVTAQKVVCDGE